MNFWADRFVMIDKSIKFWSPELNLNLEISKYARVAQEPKFLKSNLLTLCNLKLN